MANDDDAPSARAMGTSALFESSVRCSPRPPRTASSKRRIEELAAALLEAPAPPARRSASPSRPSSAGGTSPARDQAIRSPRSRARSTPARAPIRAFGPARRSHRTPAPRASALDLPASPRQPPRARARGPAARSDARLRDGVPLHEGPGPSSRAQETAARRRHRLRAARDALVRGRPRPRTLAPGLPRGLARHPHRRRRVEEATRPRHPRRSLAPLLPLAVVPRRDRRGAHPRPLAGLPQTRTAPRSAHRQRRRHARRRDHSKASSASASSITRRCRTRPSKTESRSRSGGRSRGASCPCSRASPSSPSSCSTPPRRPGSSRSTTARTTPRSSETPLARYLRGPSVGREGPSSDALRRAFRTEVTRKQRRSDGTVTVEGVRFEIPAAYRTLSAAPPARRPLGPGLRRPRRPALRRAPRHAAADRQGRNAERVRRILRPTTRGARAPQSASLPTCAR